MSDERTQQLSNPLGGDAPPRAQGELAPPTKADDVVKLEGGQWSVLVAAVGKTQCGRCFFRTRRGRYVETDVAGKNARSINVGLVARALEEDGQVETAEELRYLHNEH